MARDVRRAGPLSRRRRSRAAGLLAGVLLDAAFGDPRRGHPVAAFGTAAGRLEARVWHDARFAGAAYWLACVAPVVAAGFTLEHALERRDSSIGRWAATAGATWLVLGGRSLGREALGLGAALARDDVADARRRLPALCGRDPAALDSVELARAAVESVAENASDAMVAPLLWGAAFGVPGLLGYRAVNTLDAMVGHRSARYYRFGWAAARLDDVANYLPARVCAVLACALAPVVGGRPGSAWQVVRRDGGSHPSPNAGRCEAAFAGALGVTLGGRNVYAGRVERRPTLGAGAGAGRRPQPPQPPQAPDIARAVRLLRAVTAAAALTAAIVTSAVG